jgi:diazepam-binding inhibitor (GABA receptor modulator, acyl-CoA-binding protein)
LILAGYPGLSDLSSPGAPHPILQITRQGVNSWQTLKMDQKEQFENAVKESKHLSERPSNETLLQLYSLYKQSTEGDNATDPPANPFDFVAKAKYDAWSELRGKGTDQAMQEYVALVNKLKN